MKGWWQKLVDSFEAWWQRYIAATPTYRHPLLDTRLAVALKKLAAKEGVREEDEDAFSFGFIYGATGALRLLHQDHSVEEIAMMDQHVGQL